MGVGMQGGQAKGHHNTPPPPPHLSLSRAMPPFHPCSAIFSSHNFILFTFPITFKVYLIFSCQSYGAHSTL